MDKVSFGILIAGGILGLLMLRYALAGKNIPKGMALVHGLLVVTGFLLLIAYNLTTSSHHKHWQSVGVFSVAIVFGLYLFWRDISHKGNKKFFYLLHGLVGLGGIGLLYYHVFGSH